MKKSSDVPEPIKRIVRQEAGFGCCKCGFPIYQYHHIIPKSEDPEEIMLLCPICHHEATVGAMKEKEQRFHKLSPFNIKRGYVDGKLKINEQLPVLGIGSNQFVGEGDFILVDNKSLLSLEADGGRLEVTVELYDPEDHLVALIDNNEWISGDPLPWDLESSFQYLKIRHKLRKIALEIDARKSPTELRADLWYKGQNFQLDPQKILFNSVVQNSGFINICFVALQLVVDTKSRSFGLRPNPKIGNASIVSWPSVKERIQRGVKAWEKLIKR